MSSTGREEPALLRRRLRVHVRGRLIWLVIDRVTATLAWLLGALLLLLCVDHLLDLPSALRLIGDTAIMVLCLWRLWLLLRIVIAPPSLYDTALLVERLGDLQDNRVINAVQFAEREVDEQQAALIAAVAASANDALDHCPRGQLFARWPALLRCLSAVLVLALALSYLRFFPEHARNAWARCLNPLADRPALGSFVVDIDPGGSIERYAGQALNLRVLVRPIWEEGMPEPQLVLRRDASDVYVGESGALPVPLVTEEHGRWLGQVGSLRGDLVVRAQAGDSASPLLRVTVLPRPQLEGSYLIKEPAYTARPARLLPSLDERISCLPGSRLTLRLQGDGLPEGMIWALAGQELPLAANDGFQQASISITEGMPFRLLMPIPEHMRNEPTETSLSLHEADITLTDDAAPTVSWQLQTRNRLELPGSSLLLPVQAEDDIGLAMLRILVSDAADPASERELKRWSYTGPPGRQGLVQERLSLHLAPLDFPPGRSHVFIIEASDFRPGGPQVTRSDPLVLRVRGLDELRISGDQAFGRGIAQLQEAIAAEERALGLTASCRSNLSDIVADEGLASQSRALLRAQGQVHEHLEAAIAQFSRAEGGAPWGERLRRIVEGEGQLVLRSLETLPDTEIAQCDARLGSIRDRQERMLQDLVDCFGAIAGERSQLASVAGEQEEGQELDPEDLLRDMADDLKRFSREQRTMLERSKTLVDRGPTDLSLEEEEIIGELARHQEEWAKLFEERLSDFGKLPDQDFADSSLIEEWNEVYQEMQLAADALYKGKVELAVPHEQAGLESAEEIMHNIERWLADAPDHQLWSMEEPETPPDAPLADLPDELEDLIGELLDDLETMETEVEDVSSSWMDSLDKGAGWGTSDGPISNMSARGVTGNVLPNQNEVGGRSGEGRSGRSHGQMVEGTADGKGGRETPTRLTPSPFEQGSVADSDSSQTGGATGGGKQSGYAGEGLLGPTPPPQLQQRMQRLADQQAALRQRGSELALELRRRGFPSGDLEAAVQAMELLEQSARQGDGGSIARAYSGALDGLGSSQAVVLDEVRLRRQRSRLSEEQRQLLVDRVNQRVPEGMEDLLQRYYQALAGQEVGR